MGKKIIQLIPAPENLYALYEDGEEPIQDKIVCLALVDEVTPNGYEQSVRAMVWCGCGDGMEFAEDSASNYAGLMFREAKSGKEQQG